MFEMFGIGTPEFIVMGAILLLLIGSTRLPKFARSFSDTSGELQKGFKTPENQKTKKKRSESN